MYAFPYQRRFRGRGAIYTGHGGFWKNVENRFKQAGRIMGPKIRGALENKAVQLIQGNGAYANSLVNKGKPQRVLGVPSFTQKGDETGALTITHREYLTDLFGPASTAFTNQSYALNPGLAQSFPWLAQLAQNYEEFEFKQLMFYFRSTTSDIGNSTSGQVGTVIMATQYNAADQPFSDKQSMLEYDGAMDCKLTEHMMHGIECDRKKRNFSNLFIRTSGLTQGQDIKTYDHGLFNVAMVNSPAGFANLPVGELWVAYTVTLRKPRFFVSRALNVMRDLYLCDTPSVSRPVGTGFGAANQVNPTWRSQANNLNCNVDFANLTAGALTITWPAGVGGFFEVTFRVESAVGNPILTFSVTPSVTGNVQTVQDMYAGGNSSDASPAGSLVGILGTLTGQSITHVFVTPVTGNINNTLKLTYSMSLTSGTTLQQGILDIYQYNNQGVALGSVPIFIDYAGNAHSA